MVTLRTLVATEWSPEFAMVIITNRSFDLQKENKGTYVYKLKRLTSRKKNKRSLIPFTGITTLHLFRHGSTRRPERAATCTFIRRHTTTERSVDRYFRYHRVTRDACRDSICSAKLPPEKNGLCFHPLRFFFSAAPVRFYFVLICDMAPHRNELQTRDGKKNIEVGLYSNISNISAETCIWPIFFFCSCK